MLTSLIHLPEESNPSTEDIFSSALGLISPDGVLTLHGDPGSFVTYMSEKFGDITLRLAEPQTEQDRKMFGQYLWNAGILLAESICGMDGGSITWDARGERFLELGAGTGLAGIVSMLSGAEEVVISDYPARELLANIEVNIEKNIPEKLKEKISVEGHAWGILMDPFSKTRGYQFTRILSADCLWLSGEHENLIKSMLHFLSYESAARVWMVAGFHTGRFNLASFFAAADNAGLETETIYERNVDGRRRTWTAEDSGQKESIADLRKWLVVASMKRRNLLPTNSE